MAEKRFDVGREPTVLITDCKGDLVVRPWLELDVLAKGEFEVEKLPQQLVFDSIGDLVLNVPEGASIHVTRGLGDVVIRNISGDVSLESVSGDLILNNLGGAKVGYVASDLVAKNFSGPLSVQKVDGDVVVRNIDGDTSLELVKGDILAQFISGTLNIAEVVGDINIRSVSGDVKIVDGRRDANLRNIGGQCVVKSVAGDTRLLGGLGPYSHSLSARGDFVLIWPLDAPLLLEAEASSINNRLPLLDLEESAGKISGRLGDGKTQLSITAGGRLVLKEAQMISKKWDAGGEQLFDFDFISELSSLGAKISSEVNEQVARVTTEIENNFGPDFMHQMFAQFSQKAEAAAEMARKASERESARASAARQKHTERPKAAPAKDVSSDTGTSSEAQLKILKMVEKGIISPDEANMLLEALEGD
jgi:hypothetical protein